MMKKPIIIFLGLVCLLFLISCNKKEKGLNDLTYQLEFPKESPALEQFIKDYISSSVEYHLVTENHLNIYAEKNLGSQQKTMEYIQYSDEELKKYYNSLYHVEMTDSFSYRLLENKEQLYEPVENKQDFHLPKIILKEGNELEIKTSENVQTFILADLLQAYDVKDDDEIIFNIVAVDEKSFQITIRNYDMEDTSKRGMSIFMSQDLQQVFVSQTSTDQFAQNIVDGHLDFAEGLIKKLDNNGRYQKAINSSTIADTEDNKIIKINEVDYLSKDDKYVYISGNEKTIEEGKQRIQKVEDYLAGNDTYEASFDLDFKGISDALDLKSTNSVSVGKVTYFSEDYIILFLNFRAAFTGTAGKTNLIIDFQEDKDNPIYYLVDLGMNH